MPSLGPNTETANNSYDVLTTEPGYRPLLFAHRGARADAPENTIEAFDLAVAMGANGLETDVWRTADGHVVLDHDGAIRRRMRLRRTPISSLPRSSLPSHIPSFDDYFGRYGDHCDLSIDLKDPGAWKPIIDMVRREHEHRLPHLWLCHPDIDVLTEVRAYSAQVRLVHSIRSAHLTTTVEGWAQHLATAQIDALNMRQPDWSAAHVITVQKFGVRCFIWDVQTDHELATALHWNIDGMYSDHVQRMVAAYNAYP